MYQVPRSADGGFVSPLSVEIARHARSEPIAREICTAGARPACFTVSNAHSRPVVALNVKLRARHAEALAELVPVLLCGEESAVLTFHRYASSACLHATAREALGRIEADEQRHALWLQQLRLGLPAPRADRTLSRHVRHFFVSIRENDLGRHLTRIAALDSAVCTLLGMLRGRRSPIAADSAASGLIFRIHRDEVCHVAVASHYARLLAAGCDIHSVAAETRECLAGLLLRRADAFERLEICPDRLIHRLRKLPRKLFA